MGTKKDDIGWAFRLAGLPFARCRAIAEGIQRAELREKRKRPAAKAKRTRAKARKKGELYT
jgi:hypothetical protein